MNAEEQAELLSRVDIFESLQKGEIRELLSDLLQRNAEINLQAGEVFYTPPTTRWQALHPHEGEGAHLQDGRHERVHPRSGRRGDSLRGGCLHPSRPKRCLCGGYGALRLACDGSGRCGAPDTTQASGGHQDNKHPLGAPPLLRDAHARCDSQRGASEASEPHPLPRGERGSRDPGRSAHQPATATST
jgi:hypothetical protein